MSYWHYIRNILLHIRVFHAVQNKLPTIHVRNDLLIGVLKTIVTFSTIFN